MPSLFSPVPALDTTDPTAALVADLRRWCGWSEFARSLASQFERKGYLTLPQAEAGARMVAKAKQAADDEANRAEGRTAEREQVVTMPRILQMFTMARQSGLKRPKIRFSDADGNPIVLTSAGSSSKHAGSVYVTDDRPYGSNFYFGRIGTDGVFVKGRDINAAVVIALVQIEENPAAAAAAYGRRTGCCCFCSRLLTAEDSVTVGYGPICAANHGLPHGGN